MVRTLDDVMSSVSLTTSSLLLVLLSLVHNSTCQNSQDKKFLKILILCEPLRGHLYPMLRLSKKLAARNHNVTVVVGTDEKEAKELQKLSLRYQANFAYFESDVFNDRLQLANQVKSSRMIFTAKNIGTTYSKQILEYWNKSLSSEKYDIIIGNEFGVPPLLCINSYWHIPVVLMGSSMSGLFNEQPSWPWPGVMQGDSSDNLQFRQRLISSLEKVFVKLIYDLFMMNSQYYVLNKFCPLLTKEELHDGPGVYLPHIVPTVVGLEFSRTSTPLMSYIGPIIPDDPIPLSQNPELEAWLYDQPDKSVVYLSMGSGFPLDLSSAKSLVEGVMYTNYSLLWSLRKDNQWILSDINIDKNRVYISEWTPQFSVLASKAIHSAILHGGYNGLCEALWNEVPVIGFPQMMEQTLNIGRLYHNKLGLRLFQDTLTADKVAEAITTINNVDYRYNMKKLKKMFKLAGGLNRAVDLIEFYSEEGYAHLIPAYAKYQWSWIQFYNVDVWLLFISIVGLLLYLFLKIVQSTFRISSRKYLKEKTL